MKDNPSQSPKRRTYHTPQIERQESLKKITLFTNSRPPKGSA